MPPNIPKNVRRALRRLGGQPTLQGAILNSHTHNWSDIIIDISKDMLAFLIKNIGAAVENNDAVRKIQAILQAVFTTHGDVLFRGATEAQRLAPAEGAGLWVLRSHGPGVDPSWQDILPEIIYITEGPNRIIILPPLFIPIPTISVQAIASAGGGVEITPPPLNIADAIPSISVQAIASEGGGVVITPADLVIPIPTVSAVASPISSGAVGAAIADDGGVQTNETTPANEAAIAIKENYTTGDDGAQSVNNIVREAQTFTPAVAQTLESIKLKLYRVGTPSNSIIHIAFTDGAGHPDTALPYTPYAKIDFDGNAVTTDPAGAWYEFTFPSVDTPRPVALKAGQQYALILKSQNGGLYWRCDTTSPTYSGGRREVTIDAATTWTSDASRDFMFETWGKLCDMTLLPAAPAVNDAYYFGLASLWDWLSLYIPHNGQGTWTITWEYWDGAVWAAIPNAYDTSSGFRIDDWHSVAFPRPSDWALLTIQGLNLYWIRARVSAFTSMGTQPLGTQAWIGVH